MQKTLATAALILFSSAGWTADSDAEATIRLMGKAEAELPEAVTKEIKIPIELMNSNAVEQQKAVEKAQEGLDKAKERLERRNNGQAHTDEARERGADMKEKAKENQENRGRSEDRPAPPVPPPGA